MWFKIEIKKTFSSKSALFEKSSFFHLIDLLKCTLCLGIQRLKYLEDSISTTYYEGTILIIVKKYMYLCSWMSPGPVTSSCL